MSSEWKGEGIDPRFTLANERTFLAWSRTSLALMAGGLGISQLLHDVGDEHVRNLIGIPLILVGGLLSLFAELRQRRVQKHMEDGKGVPGSILPAILSVVLAAAAIAGILMVAFD
jgi:putative membrane protein